MMNFIMNNWVSLLIALVAGTYTIYLVVTKQWGKLREKAVDLMELAEKSITGTKKGKQRMAYVLNQVYELLPGWLKVFVSRERMQQILQDWYNDIKDYLNNGKVDGSIDMTSTEEDAITQEIDQTVEEETSRE